MVFYRIYWSDAVGKSLDLVEIIIRHFDHQSPEAVSTRMLASGDKVRAVAVVTAEHAPIFYANELQSAKGVATCELISELTTHCDSGFIGLDNGRGGRTAAWAIAGLCIRPRKVAILVGNHHYRCQEMNEQGFQSLCGEYGSEFTLLEPLKPSKTNPSRAMSPNSCWPASRILSGSPFRVAPCWV